jgi:hypothetical protein
MDYFKNSGKLDNLSLVLVKKGELKLDQWPIDEKLGPNGKCLIFFESIKVLIISLLNFIDCLLQSQRYSIYRRIISFKP